MNDSVALDRLVEKSNELKHGPKRIAVLEGAVRLADEDGDPDARFRTRLLLIEAATFGGRPDLLLEAFSWCLAAHDRDPDRFDLKDLLWKYKWVVGNAVEVPDIGRQQIEAMLADMERRFEMAGSTLQVVHQMRREVLADMGDVAGAAHAAAQAVAIKRDWLSDCRACVHDIAAGQYADTGRDAEALVEATPILMGRLKCTHVPHKTYGRLLLPLLRLGRVEEALTYHRLGYQLIGDNPEFLTTAAQHLVFLMLTGNTPQALSALATHLPGALETTSVLKRMRFFASAWLVLEMLREQGQEGVRLRVPAAFPIQDVKGVQDTSALAKWFRAEAEALAAAFDARNGNDFYTRWLESLKDLRRLAVDAPLPEEEDY